MQLQFLYYEDCPSHEDGLARLQQAIRDVNLEAEIEIIKVESDEQARELHFVGSPTFLVNGQDIIPPPVDAYYALTCRAYWLEDGRVSPLPSLNMLRSALQKVVQLEESKQ